MSGYDEYDVPTESASSILSFILNEISPKKLLFIVCPKRIDTLSIYFFNNENNEICSKDEVCFPRNCANVMFKKTLTRHHLIFLFYSAFITFI